MINGRNLYCTSRDSKLTLHKYIRVTPTFTYTVTEYPLGRGRGGYRLTETKICSGVKPRKSPKFLELVVLDFSSKYKLEGDSYLVRSDKGVAVLSLALMTTRNCSHF